MKRFALFNLQKYSYFKHYKSELAKKNEELRKIQKNMAQWKVKIVVFLVIIFLEKYITKTCPKI